MISPQPSCSPYFKHRRLRQKRIESCLYLPFGIGISLRIHRRVIDADHGYLLFSHSARKLFVIPAKRKDRIADGLSHRKLALHNMMQSDEPLIDIQIIPEMVTRGHIQNIKILLPCLPECPFQERLRKVKLHRAHKTRPDAEHVVFSDEFAQDEVRQKMWKSYLKKIKYKDELPFDEVMSVIKERLQGMME